MVVKWGKTLNWLKKKERYSKEKKIKKKMQSTQEKEKEMDYREHWEKKPFRRHA